MVCKQIISEATTTKEKETNQKSQKTEDEIKIKLHKDNQAWNIWKFHIHWNKLEWVNPRSRKEEKHCVSSNFFYLDNVKTAHWVGH